MPVKTGAGVGRETRIMENRRLVLKSGKVVDVRHAYSLPPDELVAAVGPVDTEIGVLRLDRLDGFVVRTVAGFLMILKQSQVGIEAGDLFHRVNVPNVSLQVDSVFGIHFFETGTTHFSLMQIAIGIE